MKTLKVLALVFLAARVYAQDLPDAPRPHLDRTQWSLLASDATMRGLDIYSTRAALSEGRRDLFLPHWIAGHYATMTLYSGGLVYAQYWVARKLVAHRHPKFADAIMMADIVQVTPCVIDNLHAIAGAAAPNQTPAGTPIPIPVPDAIASRSR